MPSRATDTPVTPEVVAQHGLTPEEYARVLRILGRAPNLVELGIFSVMWSEHCSYKSSRVHLRKFPTKGPRVLQGPGENAGVVDIGEGFAVIFKMESHNHPSFIEPYQGAATGVGGILRDVFTMGARPIASLDALRFGTLDDSRQRHLVDGVVSGIGGDGNSFGCPTVGGETAFHPCYQGNILVNAFNLGLVKTNRIFRAVASGVGNPVIYVGSRTGRDGIHGATMASEEFGEGSEEKRPTVQVGDPFTEKLLLEACLEAMKGDLLVGIQDMGAAGLTSSSLEMASRGGAGVEIDLSKVPLREVGMTPYEIMLSESQERMLLVVKKGREEEVKAIFRKWDLQVEVVGCVSDDGMLRLLHEGRVVGEIPVKPLVEEAPVYERAMCRPQWQDEVQVLDLARVPAPGDLGRVLLDLLGSPGLASKAWVWRQYDSLVRSNTLVGPGGDAAVIRVKTTRKALALSVDCNHRFCYLDPRRGAALAVAEAARNLSCVGALALAITDCLNFGNPEKPEIMWQFAECVEGISEACRALEIPVVSGNVSFYNETRGRAIYPTPMIAMVGLIEDATAFATPAWREAGDLVALLGRLGEELGGSEYLAQVHGLEQGKPPELDWTLERAVQAACRAGIARRIFRSAHDCAEGGLAVALAEACFGEEALRGAEITLPAVARPDAALFGESASRIIVSFRPEDLSLAEEVAREMGAPLSAIGRVGGERLRVNGWVDLPVAQLHAMWAGGLRRALREEAPGASLASEGFSPGRSS
ncbi:MAG: phosphoribosylformylglycinamidine synthase II [Deltaproteobacteria bacterium RBG_13_65_10]|nr:MAG: phosphoribosylformylglycinamidine synthase II [Deltaproteobacteria bacterium RBG_13_65_10]